ncbi:MAG: excinuclease ABC subunit C [Alphaproteobacteria bacterium]|nr:excinuclease ABC subunit C [Rickettsiales bacterium]
MVSNNITNKIKSAPETAGVYRYFDEKGRALYIGKAKNLLKRLSNYLRPDVDYRIAKMLSLACSLDWIETSNESKALLTEALQIRDMQPRYNVLLKDDKSFLELCFSKCENYGKIFARRAGKQFKAQCTSDTNKLVTKTNRTSSTKEKSKKENLIIFAPFFNSTRIKQITELVQKVFLIRDCPNTTFAAHAKNKRPCLQYYIKRCSAPCAGLVSKEDYLSNFNNAILFCSGNVRKVLKDTQSRMINASNNTNYELAKIYRDQIQAIREMRINTESEKIGDGNADFISIEKEGHIICFFVRLIRNYSEVGVIDLFASVEEKDLNNIDNEMAQMIVQFYHNKWPPSKIIIINKIDMLTCKIIAMALKEKNGKSTVVQFGSSNEKEEIGIKKTKLAAKYALANKILNKRPSVTQIYTQIKNLFNLPTAPSRIEIFDNSHLFGTNAIGAMVVATQQGFEKSEYRSYSFKNFKINTSDDYSMMRNMLTRRLEKIKLLIEEPNNQHGNNNADDVSQTIPQVPDLLIIDGGIGHLRVVKEAMNAVGLYIPVVSMAKGVDRNAGKEVYFTQEELPIVPEYNSLVALYLQNIRDEAHRFAISLHRKKRLKNFHVSKLDSIFNIGKKRKVTLLSYFGSVEKIKEATVQEIMLVSGISQKIAQQIYNYFR